MDEEVRVRKKNKQRVNIDYTMIFIVMFLLLVGLVMLYSVSSYEANLKFGDAAYYFKKQLGATVIGIVAMFTVMFFDYHIYAKFAGIAYVVSLALIFLILSPLGYEAGGARRWLKIGISVQPAEIAKLALILFFSVLVSGMGENVKSFKMVVKALLWAAPHVLTVLIITSNLSSAIIIGCIAVMIMFVATPEYKQYVIILLLAVAVAVAVVMMVKYDVIPAEMSYRLGRIKAWLNPEDYASDKGYQTLQALYAIGSGGFFGKGLGESMQKLGFIPEAQNDMIFSIICEELGLFGAFAIIILFVLLIWRFVVIANNARDSFGTFLVVGVMAHISVQVIFNIAVVTNTIPNTGITLPFISYGGTSIVFLLMEMGLVLSVAKSIKIEE